MGVAVACIKQGEVPDILSDLIVSSKIVERLTFEKLTSADISKMKVSQLIEIASYGLFIRDPKRDVCICPNGKFLTSKKIEKIK